MQLKPELVNQYLAAHADVWPAMRDALRQTGWRDYSLFIDQASGLVVGYLQSDDFESAKRAMNAREVNERWQATMAHYFVGQASPDSTMKTLTEYFHLD